MGEQPSKHFWNYRVSMLLMWTILWLFAFCAYNCQSIFAVESDIKKDLKDLSIKQIQQLLFAHGLQCEGCLERSEYLDLLLKHGIHSEKTSSPTTSSSGGLSKEEGDAMKVKIQKLESEVDDLKVEVMELKLAVKKLMKKGSASSSSSSSGSNGRSGGKIDMTKGNMINGKFYEGSTMTDESNNQVNGVGNVVNGVGNVIHGNNNQVTGNSNMIHRSGVMIQGSMNRM